MKKKVLLLIASLFLLTGCTNVYNITINDNTISEEIISVIPDTDIIPRTQQEIADGIEADDQITPFIKENQNPFIDNDKIKYKKTVSKSGNNTIVRLSYDYDIDSFKHSRVYNECFEKSVVKRENGYLRLGFVGEFYCLRGDSITINIKTNRKVLNDTADDVENNVYKWTINDSNQDKVNIQMILDDKVDTGSSNGYTLILVVVLIIFIGIELYFIFHKKERKKK
jgi:hypothetical protein